MSDRRPRAWYPGDAAPARRGASHAGDAAGARAPIPQALWWCACAALCGLCLAPPARAEDLSLQSAAWNGLSDLLELARATAPRIAAPARIDLAALTTQDGLLIVHPRSALPVPELASFLRAGGRVGVVDDLGSADRLLHAFAIERTALPQRTSAQRLRDNRNLLLATAQSDHPLAGGVGALVTNHPQLLHHLQLTPVFALADPAQAIVLAGAVGEGRLVAVSDASVLINNMLELQGNRRFAQNLVKYLSAERTGTLYLADSHTQLRGGSELAPNHPLRRLSAALTRIAELPLPPLAVTAVGLALSLLLLVSAMLALPRRSSYGRRFYVQPVDCPAGYGGRVAAHEHDRDLSTALLALKLELEHQLAARLGLREPPPLDQLLTALRRAGLPQAQVEDAQRVLRSLDALSGHGTTAATSVSRRKFSDVVRASRRILAQLPRPPHA